MATVVAAVLMAVAKGAAVRVTMTEAALAAVAVAADSGSSRGGRGVPGAVVRWVQLHSPPGSSNRRRQQQANRQQQAAAGKQAATGSNRQQQAAAGNNRQQQAAAGNNRQQQAENGDGNRLKGGARKAGVVDGAYAPGEGVTDRVG